MNTYTTLIATVGASLAMNLSKKEDCKDDFNENRLDAIIQKMVSRSWGDPESARDYGSEINSTVSLLNNFDKLDSGKFDPVNLYFFISDTANGEKIGRLLKGFFEKDAILRFKRVEVVTIKNLKDDDEYAFAHEGLRNLVREFAKVARNHRYGLAVNATGGYKAQIAFALALGQAMKFPVFYRFEGFNRIIKMPPLPVSLDWQLYVSHHELLDQLENNSMFSEKTDLTGFGYKNYAEIPEELKSFLEREKMDQAYYLGLSPMGQVFIESAREMVSTQTKLQPSAKKPEDKSKYIQDESHALEFARKYRLYEKLSAIEFLDKVVGIQFSTNFELSGARAKQDGEEIYFEYGNKGGTHRFKLYTTAKNPKERLAALEKVKETAKDW